VKLLWMHVRRRWRRFGWGILMLLLTNLSSMAIPQLLRLAVNVFQQAGRGGLLDAAASSHDHVPGPLRWFVLSLERLPMGEVLRLSVALCAVAVAGMLFRTASRIHLLFAARDVEVDIRCVMYRHLTDLDARFYAHHPTGDLLSRATNDLTQVRLMLGPGILNLFNTIVAYAMALPLMLWMSPKLTCIAFAMYPPALWIMRNYGRRLYAANKQQQQALGKLTSCAQENLRGAFLVRAFAAEATQEQTFKGVNDTYLRDSIALSWTRSGMFRLSMSLASFGTMATVLWGGMDVMAGRLSLGDVVAIVEYMALLSWPTFALGWVLSLWQRGAASLSRIEEILDTQPVRRQLGHAAGASPVGPAGAGAAPRGTPPSLRLAGLSIRYGDRVALDRVSLKIPAGTTLGIVGAIGSGKSTLLGALMRLVEVSDQQLFINDAPLESFDDYSLRRMFGLVPQNPSLFSKTIAENVAFGVPQAPRSAIEAAVAQAAFAADVAQLPEGLDTQVGERGITLSGGQKQRCAIARALLLDPPILVLDDALSAVDVGTEVQILNNLRAGRAGRTTLIVAHRLSAVQHADQILVLEAGRVLQLGTHAELLAAPGFYATLASQQQSSAASGREGIR
jgi:ATP-binding cassette subfamily B multidrug efflux pump